MMKQEYKWDISLLKRMKSELLSSTFVDIHYRDEDIKIIEELLALVSNQTVTKNQSLEERARSEEDNCHYIVEQLDKEQASYLQILEKRFHYITSTSIVGISNFQLEDIFALLEKFIKWFPSKKLSQFLQIYYERDFSTHFYYCKDEKNIVYRGSVYQLNYFLVPFMIVTKETFIETFITLVHEMGHVLTYILGSGFSRSKCGNLFSEIDGRYFEELAKKFLEENDIRTDFSFKSSVDSYNDVVEYLKKVNLSQVTRTFFTHASVEEMLCEVYSYLGSLELLERYQGDYEKQLYDLIQLSEIQGNDMSEYLKSAGFLWRENDFKVLEKRRKWLTENII